MALILNDNIQNNSPKSLDAKYTRFTSGITRSYSSTSEAISSIPVSFRSVGLTVLINVASVNVEYWWRAGTADGDLVPKSTSVSASAPLISTSGNLTINQSSTSIDGYLSSTDWNTFNNKVNTAANLGSGVGLFANKTGTTLNFKGLVSGTSGVTITSNSTDVIIAISGTIEFSPATTTDSVPTVIGIIPIEDNSAGFVEVGVVGVSTVPGSAIVSKKYAKYQKLSGVLNILGVTEDIIPDSLSGFTTTSWDIVVNIATNNLEIEVTGENSSIKWIAKAQKIFNS
jgi:hypothetical protein